MRLTFKSVNIFVALDDHFSVTDDTEDSNSVGEGSLCKPDPSVEAQLLSVLCELSLTLPMSSTALCSTVAKRLDNRPVSHDVLTNLLLKFATQQIIRCGRSQVIQKIKIALFYHICCHRVNGPPVPV